MGRYVANALFPALAVLLGVAAAAFAVWRGVDAASAAAVGVALFAALLSVRNWRLGELERPLLADELLGVHDSVDTLREDMRDVQERMHALAEVLEEAVAAGAVAAEGGVNAPFAGVAGYRATRALEARIAKLEATIERLTEDLSSTSAALEAALEAAAEQSSRSAGVALDAATDPANAVAAPEDESPVGADARSWEDRPWIGDDLEAEADAEERAKPPEHHDAASQSPKPPKPSKSPEPLDIDHAIEEVNRGARTGSSRVAARAARQAEDLSRKGEEARPEAWEQDDGAPAEAAPAHETATEAPETPVVPSKPVIPPKAPAAAAPASQETPPRREPRPAAVFSDDMANAPFDLSLQPIISLADREPRYFEAMFDAGVDPAAALVKAAAVARRLSSAGQEAPVLCMTSMAALRDEAVLRGFMAFAARWESLPDALRLEFSQAEIDFENSRDLSILQRLRSKGFMFSIGRVDDFSLDIASLARAGFRTVKLDVGLVLSREREAGGDNGVVRRLVTALDRAGLELVLENLDTIALVRDARDAGARLGQGEAIAPPRLAAVESAWLAEDEPEEGPENGPPPAPRGASESATL